MAVSHIITDLGFGDSGKGVFTHYLATKFQHSVVIRYNGGHQCGHNVTLADGRSHVFSNFGSGTLAGRDTFFSRFCTIDPVGIVNEHAALAKEGWDSPSLFIDPLAMVVTPYDKWYNVTDHKNINHGTVGVGFGATIARNEGPYKLYAQDLQYPAILRQKLYSIFYYYRATTSIGESSISELLKIDIDKFIKTCEEASGNFGYLTEEALFKHMEYEDFIFEGGQGVMLDMDFGIFPNVTRSHTTCRNAVEMLNRNGLEPDHVYNLTRAYQTRHGNGWMSAEAYPIQLKNNEKETNKNGGFQGDFRTGIIDLDLISYALDCNELYSQDANRHMVVSCLDQIDSYLYLSHGKKKGAGNLSYFLNLFDFTGSLYTNDSPLMETIKKHI